jgi:dephospho-CoA kinase
MMVVGVTGGIGSGKTAVCKCFEALGVPVYYADDEAKNLYHTDPILADEVISLFGSHIFENGQLNRAKLADIVFSDKGKLSALNALVHPAVARHFATWLDAQSSPYVLKEAAILIESGAYKSADQILLVTAHESLRIARVMQRDSVSADDVEARINKQWSDEKKRPFATDEIENDGSNDLAETVESLHQGFLKLASEGQ